MPNPSDLDRFFHLMNANAAARVYHRALNEGLLDALALQPHTPASLAALKNLHPRPTALLLESLRALGLLTLTAPDTFALAPLAQRLVASPYRNLGDQYWDHLPTFLHSNEPIATMDNPAQSPAHYAAQAEPLAWMFSQAAQSAATILAAQAPATTRILDLGAGSAIWSLTLARLLPAATVTAIDWPQVLPVASAFAARMQLTNRFIPLPGNYHDLALPPADLVLLANVAHLETPATLRPLLTRIREALWPQGQLALIDVLASQNAPTAALYALGLALRTQSAEIHTAETLSSLLRETGFTAPEILPLPAPPHVLTLLRTRPHPR